MNARNWVLGLTILGLLTGGAIAADNPAPGASLEDRVIELKEKIARTKARILRMQESIAAEESTKATATAAATPNLGSGGRAIVKHVNQIGKEHFRLLSVEYLVDAQPIFRNEDPAELARAAEIEVYNNKIGPGTHNLSVHMVYQARPVWIFSYVEGYRFKVTSNYSFAAQEGKTVSVRVVGFDKGGVTTKLEDRPAIKYDVAVEAEGSSPGSSGTPTS